MMELSSLSDPNAVPMPYSTYSLSLNLARRVGGWDPDWIAEDNHMGIKCFLFTMGQVRTYPLLLPTVNYTPEDERSWLGTVVARWQQARRHALGLSDVSYFLAMLPLICCHAVASTNKEKNNVSLRRFVRMAGCGVCLLIRVINL